MTLLYSLGRIPQNLDELRESLKKRSITSIDIELYSYDNLVTQERSFFRYYVGGGNVVVSDKKYVFSDGDFILNILGGLTAEIKNTESAIRTATSLKAIGLEPTINGMTIDEENEKLKGLLIHLEKNRKKFGIPSDFSFDVEYLPIRGYERLEKNIRGRRSILDRLF